MQEDDSLSIEEISAPQKGRLRRVTDSEEEKDNQNKDQFQADQLDSIDISEQSEVDQLNDNKKQIKNKEKEKKKRQPRKKQTEEFAANSDEKKVEKPKKEKQEKQPKQKKKIVETNEQTLENLLRKKFVQADDEDEPPRREMEVELENERGDVFGIDTKQQKQRGQKAKNINQLIKNRHKFFSMFEIDNNNFEIQEENYDDQDNQQFELKFQNQLPEESAVKQKVKKEMLMKAEQYKKNLHLSERKPIERVQSLQSSTVQSIPTLTKTTSLIVEENCQQPIQKEQKLSIFRKTQSFGLKQGLTENDLDDPEIELFIPKINGVKDKVFDNTLFLNRMKQKGFNRVIQTSCSQNNSNKEFSRSVFEQFMRQKQVEQKTSKINQQMNEFLNGFQTTTFEQIEQKNKELKIQKQQDENQQKDDDDSSSPDEDYLPKQGELNQESEDIDGGSSDSENSKKLIDDKVKEDKLPEKNIDINEQKERAMDEKLNFQEKSDKMSLIDDEEQEQLDEVKQLNRLQQQTSSENEDGDNEEDDEEEENEVEEKNEEKNKSKNQKEFDVQRATVHLSDDESDDQINDQDLNMFRRLKKVSTMFKERKQKEKELKEKQQQKIERQKERERMRKFIESNLLDNQAEQGSDNESHDDVVKQINDDEEEDENEEIEKELLDMIDDKLQDLNEENEIQAFQIFMDRIHFQEKEEIKKILKGEFRRKNGKVSNIDLINIEQTEEEKQARLLHKQESSAGEEYDSDFENYMKMNKDQKQEFLKEKRIQKIYQAQQEMNKQTKKNRLQEQQLFDPEILKLQQQANKKKFSFLQNKPQKPLTFMQSIQQCKKTNENTNGDNSNSVSMLQQQRNKQQHQQSSALNRLFSANIGQNGLQGQQLQKSPNKAVLLGKKKK